MFGVGVIIFKKKSYYHVTNTCCLQL